MTTVLVTVCDCCEKRVAPGTVFTEVYVKTREVNGNSVLRGTHVEVCAECVATKTFKFDAAKGMVPA